MLVFPSQLVRRFAAAGAFVIAACGDGATPPGRDPEIINTTDNFQYQISDIQDFSGTQAYTWQNTGTAATVNQSAAIEAGAANIVISDATGAQVYSRSLAENGTFASDAGTAGAWTIRVSYNGGSGTVNFRVDKAN